MFAYIPLLFHFRSNVCKQNMGRVLMTNTQIKYDLIVLCSAHFTAWNNSALGLRNLVAHTMEIFGNHQRRRREDLWLAPPSHPNTSNTHPVYSLSVWTGGGTLEQCWQQQLCILGCGASIVTADMFVFSESHFLFWLYNNRYKFISFQNIDWNYLLYAARSSAGSQAVWEQRSSTQWTLERCFNPE